MNTWIDILPDELSNKIFMILLNKIVKDNEFKNRRRELIIKRLQKTLSQKQLRQLGL